MAPKGKFLRFLAKKGDAVARQELPTQNVAQNISKKDVKCELEIKVRLPDYIAKYRKDKQKGNKLSSLEKTETSKLSAKQKFVKKFAKSTRAIPGHVFFTLKLRDKENNIIAQDDIGYTFAREQNIAKINKQKGPGVHGFLQNQNAKDPRYDFSEKFEIPKEKFKDVISFIDEKSKNPPNYTWPIAYNCVKFTQKVADVAGLKGKNITGLSNLPMETVARIQARKKIKKLKESISKLAKNFSDKEKVKTQTNSNAINKAMLDKKNQR